MEKRQIAWLIVIAGAVAASISYHVLLSHRLEQTSLLFIGIPALIAAICVLTPQAQSATGAAVKSVTLSLCIAGAFLGEGFVCILMAAPIFYLIAILIGVSADRARKKNSAGGQVISCLLLFALIPMSSEGVKPGFSLPREEGVSAERIVMATPQQIEDALSSLPRTNGELPFYLRLGFPHAVSATGTGLNPGARRVVHFAGGEGRPGDLVLEVAEHTESRVRFRALSDTSHVAHWLQWEDSEVEWKAMDASRTRVRWTLRYRRLLDPAWYFGPWERYAAGLTAAQLIQDAATPR